MTTEFRTLCAELVDSVELLLEMRAVDAKPMAITEDRVSRARALLAQPVAEGPTDEALANFTAWFCRNYPGPDTLIHRPEWHAPKVFRAAADAIARFGRPTPQPPADGEVAELVEWLQSMRDLAGEHNPDEQRRYTRAAELLERPTPQPVAVSERLPGPEDCDKLETCWQWEPDINGHHPLGLWERVHRDWVSDPDSDTTHWLPANALPTPEATNG